MPSAVSPQTAFSGRQNDLKCPPLRSGHHQRKNYFKFRDIGTPAGVPISHFYGRGRSGRRHLQRRFLRKRGAAEKASTSLQQAEPSQALPRQIPPFVTYGDIFPRSGGSLSSQGELFVLTGRYPKLPLRGSGLRGFAVPFGRAGKADRL